MYLHAEMDESVKTSQINQLLLDLSDEGYIFPDKNGHKMKFETRLKAETDIVEYLEDTGYAKKKGKLLTMGRSK